MNIKLLVFFCLAQIFVLSTCSVPQETTAEGQTEQTPLTINSHPPSLPLWYQGHTHSRPNSIFSHIICGFFSLIAAFAVPVFVLLAYDAVQRVYPNSWLAFPLAGVCAISTFNQFVYPAWLFGQDVVMFIQNGKYWQWCLLKNVIEVLIATFANIPLLYLNHMLLRRSFGPFTKISDVLCVLGGNICWMWAIDYYFLEIRKAVKNPSEYRERMRIADCIRMVSNLNPRIESAMIDLFYSTFLNSDGPDDLLGALELVNMRSCGMSVILAIASVIGFSIGAVGSVVYYNLGINSSLTCFSWLGINDPSLLSGLSRASGIFGVITAGSFNSIAAGKVFSSWAASLIPLFTRKQSKSALFLQLLRFLLTGAFAFCANLPQMELTFRNISQTSSLSGALDVFSLIGGFMACYWPSMELINRAVDIGRGSKLPATAKEKKKFLMGVLQQLAH